ncbi:MAG: tetratricopeptide repeat protein [Flavobacteriales bacterium]|nr:tetratricopeptide repeat protein [Flavobacteriales bacterium]
MTEQGIRQLAAIMFTDMVGYTALMQENEHQAKKNRDRHRKVLQESVSVHQGKILQYYGDGTLMIFNSAIEAIDAAVDIQVALQLEPKIPLRIGIHTGDIVYNQDGIFGDGVNLASRVEDLSIAGSVLISGKVYDEIKNHPEFNAKSLGKFDLKNVKQPIEVFALTNEGLSVPKLKELKGRNGTSDKTIAVLPFVNMSTDPENEYFSDGITEELLNALTKVDGLLVTSRTSSFAFKGKNKDIREIGKALGVKTVLEGSVRKAGDKVRITAQLINAADGYHIWSEVYDRKLEDIFAIQDEIARIITNKLREKLTHEGSKESLVNQSTENLEAYNLYLKGLFYWNKWTPEDRKKAVRIFEEAIEKEPNFALPYSGLANCYSILGSSGQLDSKLAFPKAKKAALKALELDDNLMESYLALAFVKFFYDWDDPGAYKLFQRALDLNPGASIVHHNYALYLIATSKLPEAVAEAELAVQLDPLSTPNMFVLGNAYFFIEQYKNADEQFDKILDLDPQFRAALEWKGWVSLGQGNIPAALRYFKKYQKLTGSPLKGHAGLGYTYALAGKTDKALQSIEKVKERERVEKDISVTVDLAVIYAGLKDYNKVFYYLERAAAERFALVFIKAHPLWKEVRKDPRFNKLMKKMGLDK